jgi:hypothetical protein
MAVPELRTERLLLHGWTDGRAALEFGFTGDPLRPHVLYRLSADRHRGVPSGS